MLILLFHDFSSTVSMFKNPVGYQCPVSHVSLLYLLSRSDAHALSERPVHQVRIILAFISLMVRQKTQLYQFRISNVIQAEQISSRLFNRVAVRLECIRVRSRQQLPAAMSQAFMQISMQVIRQVTVFLD